MFCISSLSANGGGSSSSSREGTWLQGVLNQEYCTHGSFYSPQWVWNYIFHHKVEATGQECPNTSCRLAKPEMLGIRTPALQPIPRPRQPLTSYLQTQNPYACNSGLSYSGHITEKLHMLPFVTGFFHLTSHFKGPSTLSLTLLLQSFHG